MMRSGTNNQARTNGENPNSQRLNVPPPTNFTALHFAWQASGDKSFLESLYAAQIETSALREYMNTDGSMWIDRVDVPNAELQRARLGGIAIVRNTLYPGHALSWTFAAPATAEDVAILIPEARPQSIKIIAYNLSESPVNASLIPWNLNPGQWEVTQGVDSRRDDLAHDGVQTKQVELERDRPLSITLAPRVSTVLTLRLISKGIPYWNRPDLGISKDDVTIQGNRVVVTVHSLGALGAPATRLALRGADGKVIASETVPALKAPLDLMPKTVKVTLNVRANLNGSSVIIDPDSTIMEITRRNNQVKL